MKSLPIKPETVLSIMDSAAHMCTAGYGDLGWLGVGVSTTVPASAVCASTKRLRHDVLMTHSTKLQAQQAKPSLRYFLLSISGNRFVRNSPTIIAVAAHWSTLHKFVHSILVCSAVANDFVEDKFCTGSTNSISVAYGSGFNEDEKHKTHNDSSVYLGQSTS